MKSTTHDRTSSDYIYVSQIRRREVRMYINISQTCFIILTKYKNTFAFVYILAAVRELLNIS